MRGLTGIIVAFVLHGCSDCGPDFRQTEVEGVLVDGTAAAVARLEVHLAQARNGVNPQLWVVIDDYGSDPDSVLRGRVTDAHLLAAAGDTLFTFKVQTENGRTVIFAPGTIIQTTTADEIMSHITGDGVRLLLASDVAGRSPHSVPMALVSIGEWQRGSCEFP